MENKGKNVFQTSKEMPVWRVLCNQIPRGELAQGVYPLKLVCWLSDERGRVRFGGISGLGERLEIFKAAPHELFLSTAFKTGWIRGVCVLMQFTRCVSHHVTSLKLTWTSPKVILILLLGNMPALIFTNCKYFIKFIHLTGPDVCLLAINVLTQGVSTAPQQSEFRSPKEANHMEAALTRWLSAQFPVTQETVA